MSFALQKNSTLKEFLSVGVLKLLETGAIDFHRQRSQEPEIDCNPSILRQINPLSLKKLAFLFALLSLAAVSSWIILGCEVVHWKKTIVSSAPSKADQQLDRKLRAAQKHVEELSLILNGTYCESKKRLLDPLEQLTIEIARLQMKVSHT